jgi:hypothetical protein
VDRQLRRAALPNPTQLHGKLDPGFRAAAEKGLSSTLATTPVPMRQNPGSRASSPFGTRSTTSCSLRSRRLPPPPVETLYNSDAFPRWTKGAPYTLPFNLTGQPAASMPAGLTNAGLRVGLQIVGPAARPTIACSKPCGPMKGAAAGTWPQPKVLETLARLPNGPASDVFADVGKATDARSLKARLTLAARGAVRQEGEQWQTPWRSTRCCFCSIRPAQHRNSDRHLHSAATTSVDARQLVDDLAKLFSFAREQGGTPVLIVPSFELIKYKYDETRDPIPATSQFGSSTSLIYCRRAVLAWDSSRRSAAPPVPGDDARQGCTAPFSMRASPGPTSSGSSAHWPMLSSAAICGPSSP